MRGEAALFESDWNGVHGGALGLLKEWGAQGGLWLEASGRHRQRQYTQHKAQGTRHKAQGSKRIALLLVMICRDQHRGTGEIVRQIF